MYSMYTMECNLTKLISRENGLFNKRTEADNYPFFNLFNFYLLFKVYI